MEPDEAKRLFGSVRIARFATVSEAGRPHLVPCTFALEGDTLYTAVDHKPKTTTNLQRLRNIRANPNVAMLADHYAEDWTELWWVRADGRASIIEDVSAMMAPLSLLGARYSQYEAHRPAGPVIAIEVGRWSGWSASPGD